ncbi:MAG: hypothetical protein LAT67_14020 [Balneolales bacterium]|nr:hypothetical protein [Balneolales bacterium]
MEKKRSLENKLTEPPPAKERIKANFSENEKTPAKDKTASPEEDIIDIGLRGFSALVLSVFISAIIAGMLEVAQGWDIAFGSLPMIALSVVIFYPTYKIMGWLGFFKPK